MAPTWRYAACVVLMALVAGSAGRGAEASTRKSDEERRAEYERYGLFRVVGQHPP